MSHLRAEFNKTIHAIAFACDLFCSAMMLVKCLPMSTTKLENEQTTSTRFTNNSKLALNKVANPDHSISTCYDSSSNLA